MSIQNETQNKKSGLAIASLVLGITGLMLTWIMVGGILGILGLIFGIIALVKKYNYKGMSIAGLITSAIAIVVTIVLVVFAYGLFTDEYTQRTLENTRNYLEDTTNDTEDHFWGTKYIATDDGSTVYFNKDNTFVWYRDEGNSEDMQKGTYKVLFGEEAETFLERKEFADYNLNHERIMDAILSYTGEEKDLYRFENLTVLCVNVDSCIVNGKEVAGYPMTVYYFGFSNEKKYDSSDLNTGDYVTFINVE